MNFNIHSNVYCEMRSITCIGITERKKNGLTMIYTMIEEFINNVRDRILVRSLFKIRSIPGGIELYQDLIDVGEDDTEDLT